MKGYLPVASEADGLALIAQFDADLGLPKPGTTTYSFVMSHGGKFSVLVDSEEVMLTAQQLSAVISKDAARAGGYLPPLPEDF